MKAIRCILKPGKEKALEGFHPWIFSGALDQIDDNFKSGDLVRVFSAENKYLGTGYLNPRSQIAIRMLTFKDEEITASFFENRIRKAVELRRTLRVAERTDAYRLIHAEGDFLPGLIADRYGDYVVIQVLTAGMEKWHDVIVQSIKKETGAAGIFEKDDTESREWEGLEKRVGSVAGAVPPDFVEITENGHKFIVDIHKGQKTGFFLDQREARAKTAEFAAGKRVLNCFSYSGGFSVYAAKAGASETVSVDSSEPALNTARENFRLNGIDTAQHQFVKEDVFEYLRQTRQEFDFVVLDPPAFCKSKNDINQASRGYKDINFQAMKKIAPGGLLFTFSCSSYIDPDLFQKIVFAAAKDARRGVRMVARTGHAADHPVSIFHPEGEYLKGLLCAVDE